MAQEMHPQLQVSNSQTPAVTRRSLAAAEAAKQQAAQQAEMMKQIMTMFQPGGQPGGGPQSIGGMMQPQQQAGAAGQAKPSSSRSLAPVSPAGPPVDQQPEAGPPAVPPRSQARA
jgi:hypothetical protein